MGTAPLRGLQCAVNSTIKAAFVSPSAPLRYGQGFSPQDSYPAGEILCTPGGVISQPCLRAVGADASVCPGDRLTPAPCCASSGSTEASTPTIAHCHGIYHTHVDPGPFSTFQLSSFYFLLSWPLFHFPLSTFHFPLCPSGQCLNGSRNFLHPGMGGGKIVYLTISSCCYHLA